MKIPLIALFLALTLSAQTKAPLPETYDSSITGTVSFPNSGDRLPIASVKAVRIKPNYWTSQSVTSSLRGDFQLNGLPAGEYVLCAGSASPKYANSCFWFNGRPTLSLGSGQKLTGQKVAVLAGRSLEVRLRDPARVLASKDSLGQSRNLQLLLQGPPGTLPRDLVSTRPHPDGQSYRIIVPATEVGSLRGSAGGLRIADEFSAELPAAGFSKSIAAPAGTGPIKLELRVLGPAAARVPQ